MNDLLFFKIMNKNVLFILNLMLFLVGLVI